MAALVVAGILAFAGLADWSPKPAEVMVGLWHDGHGEQAGDLTLPALDGGVLTLEELRGRVVVLNVWATWCAPCREEAPALVQLQDEFRDRDIQFVGVSIDRDGFDAVRPFAEEFGINYPLVLDDGSVYGRYRGSTGVPTTYLIDRQGRIRSYLPGVVTLDGMRSALHELLESERH